MLNAEIIGKRIKSIRESKEMTQMSFCELINCTQAALSGYENGTKIPSIDTLYTIATQCNVSLDWLCALTNQKNNDFPVNTYADTFIIINKLLKNNKVSLEEVQREGYYTGESGFPEEYTYEDWCLCFSDSVFKEYITKLKQMNELLQNNTIDDQLYDLWLSKTVSDLRELLFIID